MFLPHLNSFMFKNISFFARNKKELLYFFCYAFMPCFELKVCYVLRTGRPLLNWSFMRFLLHWQIGRLSAYNWNLVLFYKYITKQANLQITFQLIFICNESHGTKLSHDVLNSDHVPPSLANNQTLGTIYSSRMR